MTETNIRSEPQSQSNGSQLHVGVAGGSLGGLTAAIALRARGCLVDVFERTEGSLTSRGGGIVIQPELLDFFSRHDPRRPRPLETRCSTRQILDRTGERPRNIAMPQTFTSWDALFHQMKALFPVEHYHAGHKAIDYATDNDRATVHFADGTARTFDVVVCADGSDSPSRRQMCPEADTRYAGYVAWRGFVPEGELDDDLVAQFEDKFSFYHQQSGHILCYFIPEANAEVGPDGFVVRGQRRLNWVWYIDVAPGKELTRLLTDRDGNERRLSMPAGRGDPVLVHDLWSQAAAELPHAMASLVAATREPFLQVISDVSVPTGVFGRICLLGDAAFVVRPHTAAATSKAAAEAMRLAALLDHNAHTNDALAEFDRFQQSIGRRLAEYGIQLGSNRQ